ncbi:MAG: hypothetical protein UT55_C0004G0020 [Candidatus Peregrinibacteria bacterium GW2011_GWE2_39_6]|nr:MAG: hypothetical protein UT36_C0004G0067 [Candidatus Peregrinibacteria bacterium GW2011_GWF2_39_17]KKR26656.1 MAG: hypothetical protein UT55_C0004G0020 [Candidatus Peregrinibacteria bacterium GW2011_GWE2_39_6]
MATLEKVSSKESLTSSEVKIFADLLRRFDALANTEVSLTTLTTFEETLKKNERLLPKLSLENQEKWLYMQAYLKYKKASLAFEKFKKTYKIDDLALAYPVSFPWAEKLKNSEKDEAYKKLKEIEATLNEGIAVVYQGLVKFVDPRFAPKHSLHQDYLYRLEEMSRLRVQYLSLEGIVAGHSKLGLKAEEGLRFRTEEEKDGLRLQMAEHCSALLQSDPRWKKVEAKYKAALVTLLNFSKTLRKLVSTEERRRLSFSIEDDKGKKKSFEFPDAVARANRAKRTEVRKLIEAQFVILAKIPLPSVQLVFGRSSALLDSLQSQIGLSQTVLERVNRVADYLKPIAPKETPVISTTPKPKVSISPRVPIGPPISDGGVEKKSGVLILEIQKNVLNANYPKESIFPGRPAWMPPFDPNFVTIGRHGSHLWGDGVVEKGMKNMGNGQLEIILIGTNIRVLVPMPQDGHALRYPIVGPK